MIDKKNDNNFLFFKLENVIFLENITFPENIL